MLEKIANKLLPIATKLSQQRHLSAVKDSFIISMPLVMGASLFVLLNALGTNFFNISSRKNDVIFLFTIHVITN